MLDEESPEQKFLSPTSRPQLMSSWTFWDAHTDHHTLSNRHTNLDFDHARSLYKNQIFPDEPHQCPPYPRVLVSLPFITGRGCRFSFLTSELTADHISMIPDLLAGSMLYCRLYRFLRLIGGTNLPVSRQKSTRGDR